MPVTNDETPTAVAYYHYSIWQIMMFPEDEPNNHILNTILTKLCIGCFGNEQLVIRLPNLLAFLVYGWAIYRILKRVFAEDSLFFFPSALLFVSNPYLLGFFSLCRGMEFPWHFRCFRSVFLFPDSTVKAQGWLDCLFPVISGVVCQFYTSRILGSSKYPCLVLPFWLSLKDKKILIVAQWC